MPHRQHSTKTKGGGTLCSYSTDKFHREPALSSLAFLVSGPHMVFFSQQYYKVTVFSTTKLTLPPLQLLPSRQSKVTGNRKTPVATQYHKSIHLQCTNVASGRLTRCIDSHAEQDGIAPADVLSKVDLQECLSPTQVKAIHFATAQNYSPEKRARIHFRTMVLRYRSGQGLSRVPLAISQTFSEARQRELQQYYTGQGRCQRACDYAKVYGPSQPPCR